MIDQSFLHHFDGNYRSVPGPIVLPPFSQISFDGDENINNELCYCQQKQRTSKMQISINFIKFGTEFRFPLYQFFFVNKKLY